MNSDLPISEDSSHFSAGFAETKSSGAGNPVGLRFVGDYELQEEIARGGMGIVYKARHLKLNRLVALKMLLVGQGASQTDCRRFQNEAEAAARLNHPNIVPIYEVGEHHGWHYLCMQLVEGGNLARQISRFKDSPKAAVQLMVKIAEAVHHAHERGILHRDLKPSNVLLDTAGEPFVTDFGLARILTQESDLTMTGAIIGTPNYMAPEQAEGSTGHITIASDVFSLGAIFYHLLTGQMPFVGQTTLATLQSVLRDEPVRPSSVNQAVDRDLQTICLRCLEKEARKRYDSAKAFAQELRRWLRHEPIQARPLSVRERAAKWLRRHPAKAAVIAVTALAVVGIATSITINHRQLREQRNLAEAARLDAEIRLSEALLREGDALAANNRYAEAKERVWHARRLAEQTKTSTLPAELSLTELYRFSPPEILALKGHRGKVTCLAFTPSSLEILSGGEDGTIRRWSLPVGLEEQTWLAHREGVECLAISQDGQFCISGGADNQIKVWNLSDGTMVRTIEAHSNTVTSLAFSPTGTRFASASLDKTIRLFSFPACEPLQTLTAPEHQPAKIAFSPDGMEIYASEAQAGWSIWRLQGSQPEDHLIYSRHICFTTSPDRQHVLWGDSKGRLVIGKPGEQTPSGPGLPMDCAATALLFSLEGDRVFCGRKDGTILVWKPGTSTPVTYCEHTGSVTGLALDAGGTLLASSSEDGTIRLWACSREADVPSSEVHPGAFLRLAYSPRGDSILSAGADGVATLWDQATLKVLMSFKGHLKGVSDAEFSPDGKQVVTAGQDGTVRIWDVATGRELRRMGSFQNPVRCARFSPDGHWIVAGEAPELDPDVQPLRVERSRLHIWRVDSNTEAYSVPAHTNGVFDCAFASDPPLLLTAGGDGRIRAWDTHGWRELWSGTADGQGVNRISVTASGSRCLSAGRLVRVEEWDLATGRPLRSFQGLNAEPVSLAVCESNQLVLAGMNTGRMMGWDLASGRELRSFTKGEPEAIRSIALTSSGDEFVTGHESGALKIWSLRKVLDLSRVQRLAESARARLRQARNDGQALRQLAEYYRFSSCWGWAADLLRRSERCGASISHLDLARCLWRAGRLKEGIAEAWRAAEEHETPRDYVELYVQAMEREIKEVADQSQGIAQELLAPRKAYVERLDASKDIWTTSYLSFTSGGDTPGGGCADESLKVGGWGDLYYSLLQFDLTACPKKAAAAKLCLYCYETEGGGTPMMLDRIVEPWDWTKPKAGRDGQRLWWADKPDSTPCRVDWLPSPRPKHWYVVDITDLYNEWQSGRYPNCGVQFRPVLYSNDNFNNFYSSRFTGDPSLRPRLIVSPED